MINGVTDLCITKMDVMNDFDTISITQSYVTENGQTTEELPYDLASVSQVNNLDFPGWKSAIDTAKSIDDLPIKASDFYAASNEYQLLKYHIYLMVQEEKN